MSNSIPKVQEPPIHDSIEFKNRLLDSLFGRIPLARLEMLCQRMSLGLRAGVDVLKLLETEARQGAPRHRKIMTQVQQSLRSGETLTNAFRGAGAYFPPLLVQLISAGETSGGLDRIFAHLSQHYQELRLARRQFFGQITWPLIQLGLAVGIICIVIAFIKPRPQEEWAREGHFDSLGLGLAGASGVAIFLGWVMFAAALVGGCVFAIWKNLFNCQQRLISLVLPIPILGGVISNTAMARMSMTLSMLLNAGLDAMRSVREAFLSTGNHFYIQGMNVALDNVRRGNSLAISLGASKVFPQEFIDGIEIGELSGNETESLEHLAAEYARRAKTSMTQLSLLTSAAIWIAIAMLIVLFIIRMMMQYVNLLNSLMP